MVRTQAYNKKVGVWGEDMAEKFLVNKGYVLLAKNYACPPFGEIDLIFQDKNELVFVEVKFRLNRSFGFPEEAVTPNKIARLQKAIEIYLNNNPTDLNLRIDVVAIEMVNLKPQIRHYKGIEL